MIPTPQTVHFVVRGMHVLHEQVETTIGDGLPVTFDLRQDAPAVGHFALFVNNAAYSDEVLRWPRERRLCLLAESPINTCYRDVPTLVERFPIIFTHLKSLVQQGAPFTFAPFGTNWLGFDAGSPGDEERRTVSKTKDVSFIGSLEHPDEGAYADRRRVAQALVSRSDVDCFGRGIRELPGKRQAIEPYRFSVAMENAREDWYFSEKLVDCLLLETVPVYFGCPSLGDLLDSRGVVAFSSVEELLELLPTLTPKRYNELRPYVVENRQRLITEEWHSHAGLLRRVTQIATRDWDPATCELVRPQSRRGRGLLAKLLRRTAADSSGHTTSESY